MTNKLKGFTLIEFLAVFAIIAMLSTVSLAGFSSYNNTQIFQTSVSDVGGLINLAKSRAIAQIKPSGCSVSQLTGYQVVLTASGRDYRLEAVCGAPLVMANKKLGSGVTFSTGSTNTIFFAASSGVSSPATVTVSGYNKTSVITVDSVGTISIH